MVRLRVSWWGITKPSNEHHDANKAGRVSLRNAHSRCAFSSQRYLGVELVDAVGAVPDDLAVVLVEPDPVEGNALVGKVCTLMLLLLLLC